jgi:hypothetical protein
MPPLPRVGMQLTLNPALRNLTYYGRGPHETYADRCLSEVAYCYICVSPPTLPPNFAYTTDAREASSGATNVTLMKPMSHTFFLARMARGVMSDGSLSRMPRAED